MLTPRQFDNLADRILPLYHEFEDAVLADIARRLAGLDFATATAAWQVQRLNEAGAVYEHILRRLSELTGKSEAEVAKILGAAGVRSMRFDDRLYRAAGLQPLPLNLSPAMRAVLANAVTRTQGVMTNLTRTTALATQQSFIRSADLAYLQVSTGTMSYDQAIRAAVDTVAKQGLEVVSYASGRQDKLDVAMRRTVLTAIGQTSGELQWARAEEMGVDLVQVSAHSGARPTHAVWQGKVYSRSGTHPKYPDFVSETGYGTVTGLNGVNCRHSWYPFFEGLSENAYTEAMRDELNERTVTYNGKEMGLYEATQVQRGLERRMRDWKRLANARLAAGQDSVPAMAKVRELQAKMRDFLGQTGLQRQYGRESVTGGARGTSPRSIMEALDLQIAPSSPIRGQVQQAIDEIAKVLPGSGDVERIPIVEASPSKNFQGGYNYEQMRIEISRQRSVNPGHTLVHEVGHYLDHMIGKGEFSSETSSFDKAVRVIEVARGTPEVSWLEGENQTYYLQPSEIFARAFTQYIAVKSGNPNLLAGIMNYRNSGVPEAAMAQWSDGNFAPILEALDALFRDLGWKLD